MRNFYVLLLVFFSFGSGFSQNNQNDLLKDYNSVVDLRTEGAKAYSFYNYTNKGSVDKLTGSFGVNVPIHNIKTPYGDFPIILSYSTNGVKLNAISNEIGLDWNLIAGGEINRIVNSVADDRQKSNVLPSSNVYNDGGNIYDFPYQKFNFQDVRPRGYTGILPEDHFQYFETNTMTGLKIKGAANGFLGSFYTNKFPTSIENFFHPYANYILNTEVECFNEMNYRSNGMDFPETDTYDVDTELDYFKVNLNEKNLTFIIKRSDAYYNESKHPSIDYTYYRYPNSDPRSVFENWFEAVCLDDIGYKIEIKYDKIPFYYSNNKTLGRWLNAVAIVKFVITDKMGVKYIFDKLVLADSEYLTEFYNRFEYSTVNFRFMQLKRFDTNADKWKLTKIILPNAEEINFKYEENNFGFSRDIVRQHDGEYLDKPYNLQPSKPNYGFDKLQTYEKNFSLKEIVYNQEKVIFNYSNLRPDLIAGGKNLSQINVHDGKGMIIKKFDFIKTFYSYQDDDESHEYFRMFLTKINDSNQENSFDFEYNKPEYLFRRNDVSAQDLFGYPNGNTKYNYPAFPKIYINLDDTTGNKISYYRPITTNYFETLGVDRSPDIIAAKYGTLKKINFKTGGFLNIEYENNTFCDSTLFSKKELGPGVRVNSLQYFSSNNNMKSRKDYKYDDFGNSSLSSGKLLYKPSYAYFKNFSFDNDFDKAVYETKENCDENVFTERVEHNNMLEFDHFLTKEMLDRTTNLSQHDIAKKMVHFSNYSLGNTSDLYGRELIYTNVTEKTTDVLNPINTNGETRYTYYYSDNRGFVGGVAGYKTDDLYSYPLGDFYSPYTGWDFHPYSRPNYDPKLITSKGFIEKDAKEIYPFPERNFFENLENARFGKLKKIESYNALNELVFSEEYSYDFIKKVLGNNSPISNIQRGYLKLHQYYDNDIIEKKFARLYLNDPTLTFIQANYNNWNGMHLFNINKLNYNIKVVVKNKKSTSYFGSGNNVQNDVTYNYDLDTGNVSQIISKKSNLDETKITYQYPSIYNINQNLFNNNVIDEPFLIRSYSNNILLENTEKYFLNQNSQGFPLLSAIKTKKTSDITASIDDTRIEIKKYNSKDLPVEVSTKEGVNIVYLYGYGKIQPIARLENVAYSSIDSTLISNLETLSDTGTESDLLASLNNLRNNFPNAIATTYTYKPLVGVSTVTDPKGYTIFYEYDSFNRLKLVKDAQGNVLSENQYHYKN